jgi:histone deacetylase HOS3
MSANLITINVLQDGKLDLVQAASVSIHQAHGQYIENIHLETYSSEEHFWEVLYKQKYTGVLRKAREFLDLTGGPGDDAIVFIRLLL